MGAIGLLGGGNAALLFVHDSNFYKSLPAMLKTPINYVTANEDAIADMVGDRFKQMV